MKLATAAEMAAVDRCACECHGIALTELMDRAGRCTAEAAELLLGPVRGRRVALFCGRGNNGGDGFVAARTLRARGAEVRVILVGAPGGPAPRSPPAWDAARAAGVEFTVCADAATLAAAQAGARDADLVVDALLGTGFTPPARGLTAAAISLINALGRPVLAVDIPSGLAADHGRVIGEAVRATATVTFGYPKPGLVVHPAARYVGRLWLADIGFPPGTDSLVAGELNLVTAKDLAPHLAPRDPESHKGTFGHVLLVAGSRGMAGAAALAARGALRAGAGLVTVALPASVAPPLLPGLPEAMLLPLPDDASSGRRTRRGGDDHRAILPCQRPGDGTGALPGRRAGPPRPGAVRRRRASPAHRRRCAARPRRCRTAHDLPAPDACRPHPAPRGTLPSDRDRARRTCRPTAVGAARACAVRFNAVVVLKGSRTVVAPRPGRSGSTRRAIPPWPPPAWATCSPA